MTALPKPQKREKKRKPLKRGKRISSRPKATATQSSQNISATGKAIDAENLAQHTQIALNYVATQAQLQANATEAEINFRNTQAALGINPVDSQSIAPNPYDFRAGLDENIWRISASTDWQRNDLGLAAIHNNAWILEKEALLLGDVARYTAAWERMMRLSGMPILCTESKQVVARSRALGLARPMSSAAEMRRRGAMNFTSSPPSSKAERLRLVFASDGDRLEQHRAYVSDLGLEEYPYVVSQALGMSYAVSKLPFAALVGADGVLKSKGLVNTREHLESLVESMRSGIVSLQDYVAATDNQNDASLRGQPS